LLCVSNVALQRHCIILIWVRNALNIVWHDGIVWMKEGALDVSTLLVVPPFVRP